MELHFGNRPGKTTKDVVFFVFLFMLIGSLQGLVERISWEITDLEWPLKNSAKRWTVIKNYESSHEG
jgi:hypothetical protein